MDAPPKSPFAPGAAVTSGGFACPHCHSTATPQWRTKITGLGICAAVALVFLCLPLFWVPLVVDKKHVRFCGSCGLELD